MCSANLTGLPAELLNEIVFHLGYEDRVSLASTHRDLHLLRPKEKTLRPEAFCLQSITYTVALPLLARGLIGVKMSFNSGHGNPRKICLQLIRDGKMIGENVYRDTKSLQVVLGSACLSIE